MGCYRRLPARRNGQLNSNRCIADSRLLEFRARQPGLPDDRPQGADADLTVVRHWDRDGAPRRGFLHDHMAAAASYLGESMRGENTTYLAT